MSNLEAILTLFIGILVLALYLNRLENHTLLVENRELWKDVHRLKANQYVSNKAKKETAEEHTETERT